MKVRFYERLTDETGGVHEVGSLVLKDGHLEPRPTKAEDAKTLCEIATTPMYVYKMEEVPPGESDRELLDPKTQAKAFLKACPNLYHGSYFWAGEVED